MKYFVLLIVGFYLGVLVLTSIQLWNGVHEKPADRYTVAELIDAIATRTATFAERATELEGEK